MCSTDKCRVSIEKGKTATLTCDKDLCRGEVNLGETHPGLDFVTSFIPMAPCLHEW